MTCPIKNLGEICEVNPTKSEMRNVSDDVIISFVPMSAVSENLQKIENQEERTFGDVNKGYTYFKRGDILFAKITPCMENGKAALTDNLEHEIGFASTEFHVIRVGKDVLSKYIFLLISSKKFREEAQKKMTGSAGQKRVPRSFLDNYEIPLPPIAEQKKIVARVEKLLAKVKEAKRLRAEARAAAETLLSAELHKIFEEGKKKGWEDIFFGDQRYLQIIDGDRGKNYPTKLEFSQSGYCLFLNTSNVRNGNFNFSKKDFITKEKDESLRKGKIKRGDLILTTRGTLGNSAYYDNSIPYENIRINSGMVVLRAENKKLLPQYLIYIINSGEFAIKLKEANSGSAQPQLPIKVLSRLAFLLPSITEQKKIVARLDALSAKLKKIEEYQKSAESDLDRLEQSILRQAFSGALMK